MRWMLGLALAGVIALAGCGDDAAREVSAPAHQPAAQAPVDPCDPNSALMVALRRRAEAAIKKARAQARGGYDAGVNSGCATLPIPAP